MQVNSGGQHYRWAEELLTLFEPFLCSEKLTVRMGTRLVERMKKISHRLPRNWIWLQDWEWSETNLGSGTPTAIEALEMVTSIRPKTLMGYCRVMKRFCLHIEVSVGLVSFQQLSAILFKKYLWLEGKRRLGYSSLSMLRSGILFFLRRLPSLKKLDITRTMAALREVFARPKRKMSPFLPKMVGDFLRRAPPKTKRDFRRALFNVISILTGRRSVTVRFILVEDITLEETQDGVAAIIRVPYTKSMHCDEQRDIVISSATLKPVRLLLDYMQLRTDPSPFLFPGKKVNEPISYGTARKYVKEAALLAGADPKKFACHSHRIGMVVSAVHGGVKETQISWHGAWRSNGHFQYYNCNRRANKAVSDAISKAVC